MVAHIECFSTHPIGLSIVKEFKGTIDRNNVKDMKTIPGQGLIGKYKNHKIVIGNKELLESYNINVIEDNCGSTTVFIASDHKFIASICVGDSIKQESKQCIDLLNKMNIQPILLSGDNQQTVEKVTKTLNISKYKYSLTPIEKVNYLEQQLKNSNSKIVFCGDGVNDAPALAKADVGISMGNIGSDLAIETSDVVITNDNVLKILEVITISKRTVKTARMNMIFALAIKAIVFIFTIVSGFVISQTLETASL
jgi:Cd2+/Zn2+-exporting ATPase